MESGLNVKEEQLSVIGEWMLSIESENIIINNGMK